MAVRVRRVSIAFSSETPLHDDRHHHGRAIILGGLVLNGQ